MRIRPNFVITAVAVAAAAMLLSPAAFAWTSFGTPYSSSQIPVGLSIDRDMNPDCPRDYNPLRRAKDTWNAPSCSTFSFVPRAISERSAAGVCDDWDHIEFAELQPGVLGVTYISCVFGARETDMQLDRSQVWNCSGPTGFNEIDYETIVLHEMGHMLGLGHTSVNNSVMEAFYEGERRNLGSDDENGVCALY